MKEYPGPSFRVKHFKCGCGAVTTQHWVPLKIETVVPGPHRQRGTQPTGLWRCTCDACKTISVWQERISDENPMLAIGEAILSARGIPTSSGVPLTAVLLGTEPHPDMPAPVKEVYEEARRTSSASPRAAAALLRVATELLCDALLGEVDAKRLKLDQKIAKLVKKGMSGSLQKALDALRVIGNNAVHPGQIDFGEAEDTAGKLFLMLNVLVEQLITQPKVMEAVFEKHVSDVQKQQIKKRDGEQK